VFFPFILFPFRIAESPVFTVCVTRLLNGLSDCCYTIVCAVVILCVDGWGS